MHTLAYHIQTAGSQRQKGNLESSLGQGREGARAFIKQGQESQRTSHQKPLSKTRVKSNMFKVLEEKKPTNLEFCIQRNYPSKVKEKEILPQTNKT